MRVTKPLIKRIHALLPDQVKKDPELKADLIFRYTKDASRTSTTDMEVAEAKRLISDLQHNSPENRMRKKILSICHEMQWYLPGTTHLDWNRIGNYLEKYGTLHTRDLNAYHGKDLTTLVTQFEKVLESSYKKGVSQYCEDACDFPSCTKIGCQAKVPR